MSAGTTTITIAYINPDGSTASKTCNITVYAKVTVTAFSYSASTINVGQTSAAPTKTITGTAKSGPTYTSSNTSVATVASDGKVKGVAAGTVNITIKYTNYDGSVSSKTCSLTIKSSVSYTVVVNANNASITCTSHYVTNIALPPLGPTSYFGMTDNSANYFMEYIQFTIGVSKVEGAVNDTDYPTTGKVDCTTCPSPTSSDGAAHWYGKTCTLGWNGKYGRYWVYLSDGNIVTIDAYRSGGNDSSPITTLNIY